MKYLLGHFGLGALEPHDDRHLHLGRLGSLHERGGKLVALDDSPDNVHQQDLGVGVRGDNVERLIEHGARGVAADVEEVGGRSTVVRQQIQSGHCQPRSVDDARHIAAPVLGGYGHDAAGGPVQHEGDVPLLGQSQLLRHHYLLALCGLEDLTRHGFRLRGGARQQVHRRRDSMLPQHLHTAEFRNVQKAPRVARMVTRRILRDADVLFHHVRISQKTAIELWNN
ncbi:biosynthetic arginine decarboxylase [Babesia caballi]|uniref:Biosynthetic arginine decarboxylase n=1 Tax=Babesia caballi TaxID=5871 RepID=A0AAV4LQT1_BABCB|nr:biosynthetic arginine decarboxylase [Babesia caballi]